MEATCPTRPTRPTRPAERNYLTACLRDLPALNRGTRRLGILIGAPVCGLRALRAFRFDVLNVPKPTNDTGSPFLSDFVMLSISESSAPAAADLVRPVSLAILATTSCLFMNPPDRSASQRLSRVSQEARSTLARERAHEQ